ncbi:MAG: hypothetical protein KJO40_05070 [Deltaproteobacteria bacterium]|nr:hypothetical protein [Deltaproteobacteria bacterium]NNK43184.1 hypothetical protein [Myxococcales bacterium]
MGEAAVVGLLADNGGELVLVEDAEDILPTSAETGKAKTNCIVIPSHARRRRGAYIATACALEADLASLDSFRGQSASHPTPLVHGQGRADLF